MSWNKSFLFILILGLVALLRKKTVCIYYRYENNKKECRKTHCSWAGTTLQSCFDKGQMT